MSDLLMFTQVLSSLSPEAVRDAMQRMLPFPCKTRYTAVTMVPEMTTLSRLTSAFHHALSGVTSALGWSDASSSKRHREDEWDETEEETGPKRAHVNHSPQRACSVCSSGRARDVPSALPYASSVRSTFILGAGAVAAVLVVSGLRSWSRQV